MYLKIKSASENSKNLVLIGDNSTKFSSGIQSSIIEQFRVFIESDKDFDYFKSANQFLVFVKGNSDQEKNRVAGFKARKLIDSKESEVFVEGNDEMVLNFSEGFSLSNYQFLKYFRDADKKKNELESIYVSGKISEEAVFELNTTIKSVFWARDMVNEPVSYLNAPKLSEEIEKLGENTSLDIQVYGKAKI